LGWEREARVCPMPDRESVRFTGMVEHGRHDRHCRHYRQGTMIETDG